MGIRKVKFIKNNYYHIYNRGCNKENIFIDDENYIYLLRKIIHLCRYIHRNPIEAKLVSNISEWKYSNYLDWLGMRKGKLVDKNFILDRFGSANNYKKFIEDEYKEPINFKSLCLD